MKEILQRIERGRRVLIFLDYDGTLIPIKKTPELALLHPAKKGFLRRLGKRAFLGVVSGRALSEIQRLVTIEDIAYIGNHGLEISYRQRCWVHPQAENIGPILMDVLKKIHHSTKNFPGILVEDKGTTVTIHYRLVDPPLWGPLKEIVRKQVGWKRRALRMTEGKRAFEIKPNLPWDKGKGIQELMGWLDLKERPLLIYIGDDQTDEDAFRTINNSDRSALTIHVGRAKDTHARYRLASVNEVWMFLRALFSLITEPS
jgi:trehalose-phosphatase